MNVNINPKKENKNLTTIAYKEGIISYDSLCVKGDIVIDSKFNKCFSINNTHFFYCGTPADIDQFTSIWHGEACQEDNVPDVEALVWESKTKKLWNTSMDPEEHKLWKVILDPHKHYSIGSGRLAALTLMDNGFSAVQAIEAVKERDIYTGGEIRIFKTK